MKNLKKWSKEEILNAVSSLVSEDDYVRENWVRGHLESDIVSTWDALSETMDVKYILVACFAPIYVCDGKMTRLSPRREYIHCISPAESLKTLVGRMLAFPGDGFVVFKKVDDHFEEIPFRYGYVGKDVVKEFSGSLIIPFPKDSVFWLEADGKRFETATPSYKKSNCTPKPILEVKKK